METFIVPDAREIASMKRSRCQQVRIQLKNEISFARGDETIGGKSRPEEIAAYSAAVAAIERRLRELAQAAGPANAPGFPDEAAPM
jgi:hypothetical protein